MKTIFRAWFFRLIEAVLFLAVFCSAAHAQNGLLGQLMRNTQGGTVKAMMESGTGLTGQYTATFPAQNGNVLLNTGGIVNLLQSGSATELRFYNSAGAFYTGFKAGTLTTNTSFTLPAADGTSGQVLSTNGSGALSWLTPTTYAPWNLAGNAGTNAANHFVGTTDANPLIFRTTNAERMRIAAAGNVGIGNTNPAEKLDVSGNLRFSGALMPGGSAGSIGHVLVSSGTGYAPTWQDGTSYVSNNAFMQNGNAFTSIKSLGTTTNFDLPFITNNLEEMRLTTAGRLGIGTATPAELLDVVGNIRMSGTGAKKLVFGAMPGDIDASIGLRNIPTNEQQELLFYVGNDNEAAYGPDRIRMVAEEFRVQTFDNATNSTLANAESETSLNTRFIVNAAGNVGIGTAAPTQKLTVAGNIVPSATPNTYTLGTTGVRWNALYANNLYYTNAYTSSDRRLKTNIQALNYGLKEIMSLEAVRYNWKDTTQKQNKIGLIAQDVRQIVPEVVTGDEAKETLGVSYAELVPVLINAIKEQQAQIDDLKKEISNLKKNK